MSTFKKILSVTAISLTFAGCTIPDQPLPKAELNARLISTLNVYENNQVYFYAQPLDQRFGQSWYAWTNSKNTVFALTVYGKAYNTKDIEKIVADRGKSDAQRTSTIHLKNGQSIKGNANHMAYTFCDMNKKCQGSYPYMERFHPKILTAIYSKDLDSTPDKAHLFGPLTSEIGLSLSNSDVSFLADAEIAAVEQKLARLQRDIQKMISADKVRDEQRREAEISKERAIQSEAVQVRSTIRVGTQTNCGQVFEVRRPMAGVQTMVGMQFIEISKLFGPSASCKFVNNVYTGR